MKFAVDMLHTSLQCITPTDPSGEDRPFLWVFIFKVDGTTVRQRPGSPTALDAAAAVKPGSSGRPGNIGGPMTSSTFSRSISLPLGVTDESLQPIVLDFRIGATVQRFFVPGTLVSLVVALDEESASRDPIEAAYGFMRASLEKDVNAALAAMNLGTVLSAAGSPAPCAVVSAFRSRLGGVLNRLEVGAVQSASAAISLALVLHGGSAGLLADQFDIEEPIGAAIVSRDEEEMIIARLESDSHLDLKRSFSGPGGAWYRLHGHVRAKLSFFSDVTTGFLPPLPQRPLGPKRQLSTTVQNRRCAEPGTAAEFQIGGHRQRQLVRPRYPFLTYRYSIAGKVLDGTPGTVDLEVTSSFPKFDENAQFFVGADVKPNHPVTLAYRLVPNPAAPQLVDLELENDPEDGNFSVEVLVEAELNNRHLLKVGTQQVDFVGQTLDFTNGFLTRYIACLNAWIESKNPKAKLRLSDLATPGPVERWRQFERVVERLDVLLEIGRLDERSTMMLKQAAALRLGVAPEGLAPMLFPLELESGAGPDAAFRPRADLDEASPPERDL
jgi:hypothetical protein